jgi:hypothetical protein
VIISNSSLYIRRPNNTAPNIHLQLQSPTPPNATHHGRHTLPACLVLLFLLLLLLFLLQRSIRVRDRPSHLARLCERATSIRTTQAISKPSNPATLPSSATAPTPTATLPPTGERGAFSSCSNASQLRCAPALQTCIADCGLSRWAMSHHSQQSDGPPDAQLQFSSPSSQDSPTVGRAQIQYPSNISSNSSPVSDSGKRYAESQSISALGGSCVL